MSVTVREAASQYEQHARSLGLADSYVRTQMGYLKRFAESTKDIQVRSLTPHHVTRFFQDLPNTRASHNRALSALRCFVRFLERMKYLKAGASGFLLGDRKAQKFTRAPKYYIPVSQFGPMLDAAERRHPVDRATLALAFYTLGRQGEISGLRLKDVDIDNRTIRMYREKRKRWTVVQMCPELYDELFSWLYCYATTYGYRNPQQLIEEAADWFLVPALDCIRGHTNGVFDADKTTYQLVPDRQAERLEVLVKRMLDIFGAQTENGSRRRHKGEGMHTIRRSGARAMIDYLAGEFGEDKALLMVSTMLDHETTTMTLLYIGRSLEQKRLNAFLATQSPYGTHGDSFQQSANVIRMPLRGSGSNGDGLSPAGDSPLGVGEVDAF